MRISRERALGLASAVTFSLSALFSSGHVIAEDGPAESWKQHLLSEADKKLNGTEGLSFIALPLTGPGIDQSINADAVMNPGSVMKLLTTYAALEILGPTFTWDTRFYTDGELKDDTLHGNLYVRFGGDPKLDQERVWSMLQELKGMGLKHIIGDLILDGSYFHLPQGVPHFVDNGNNPYAPFLVEPSPYLTNFNLQQFQVRADERGTRAWSSPEIAGVTIDNQVEMLETGSCQGRNRFDWHPQKTANGYVVRVKGKLAKGCRTTAYFSLMPAEYFTAGLIRGLWEDMGGEITGRDRLAVTPEDARLMVVSTSADLATTVRDINKWSNNVMARQLLLTIGAERRKDDSTDDRTAGIAAITNWLRSEDIDTRGLVIDNGAGLSRDARISARQGAHILSHIWSSRYASDLISSLSMTGMDGTMYRRLRDSGLRGEGRFKTGSLENVRSVAGFTRDENHNVWAVVGIINNTPAWNGQAVLDRAIYTLYFDPPVGRSLSHSTIQP